MPICMEKYQLADFEFSRLLDWFPQVLHLGLSFIYRLVATVGLSAKEECDEDYLILLIDGWLVLYLYLVTKL